MCTEFIQLFIQRKTGGLGRDFKEHAARLTEIDGTKISAVNYWCDVVAKIDELLAPLEVFRFALCSKRNVMH